MSTQWFYSLLERGECELLDFKEQLGDKLMFGKSQKSFTSSYKEIAKDVVAFANYKRAYVLNKKQTKQKQIEVILRYLDEFEEVDNEKAREVLVLPESKISTVSRLFKEMVEKKLIEVKRRGRQKTFYGKS